MNKQVFSFSKTLQYRIDIDYMGLKEYLSGFLNFYRFKKGSDTDWAYRKVLTHLEDGWTSTSKICELNEFSVSAGMTKDNIGQIVNIIIRGTREDTVSDGDWPTKHDLAAFVYFISLQTPLPAKECSTGC
ncbi:MAG: hypothetical protein LR008_00560 [Candidatus Pacebacteria bacterium]|nr:hypothetical protein [Candidatus Paceibacterota bacterium]